MVPLQATAERSRWRFGSVTSPIPSRTVARPPFSAPSPPRGRSATVALSLPLGTGRSEDRGQGERRDHDDRKRRCEGKEEEEVTATKPNAHETPSAASRVGMLAIKAHGATGRTSALHSVSPTEPGGVS